HRHDRAANVGGARRRQRGRRIDARRALALRATRRHPARARDRIAQRRRRRRHSPSSLSRVTDSFASLGSWYFFGIAFLFGACIGSCLNVCVSRWPHDQSVVKPRSRCPKCGHEIPWYENIPLVSWVALRARCSGCGNPISPIYPLLELVVALGWLGAAIHYGPTLTALRVAVLGTILLGIMITDATHYVIPDGFTVFGLFFALAAAGAG